MGAYCDYNMDNVIVVELQLSLEERQLQYIHLP